MTFRDRSKLFWLLGILLPILFTLIVVYEPISSLLASYYIAVIGFLSFIIAVIIVYLKFYESINNIIWRIKRKWKFRNPIIAIIKEDGCELKTTRYTPSDWRDHFDHIRYKTKIISCKEISNRYAVIINPYGEVYPEEDLFNFKTFNRIKEFIENGGIFVNVGGFAFYSGWDIKTKRGPIPIAEVYQFYGGEIKENRIELHPLQSIKGRTLTNGTLLFEKLKITPTFGAPEKYKVYQTESDKGFIGNLEDVGETNIVEEFRCVREPVSRCQPLLRAKSEIYDEIYPLAAIPLGRGYFIIGGMNLDPENDPDRKISNSAFLKSCKAIENMVERIQKGYIKSSLDID